MGNVRTALFNWMFARANDGKFFVRIEDTDQQRSDDMFAEIIRDVLWGLGLKWDGDIIYQSTHADGHVAAARELITRGKAYKCFCTPQEITDYREWAKAHKRPTLFQSPWREKDPADHPSGEYTIRLKAPQVGETEIRDAIKGRVTWKNDSLDDFVILRADGTPTYNFAVVLDDHELGITHVIRGDDHLANTPKQKLVYAAFGWSTPAFVHLPLILDETGRKLSKRTGSGSYLDYLDAGIPASAMRNYLLRLGWSHGDKELFTPQEAVACFGLEGLGKSPARLDRRKLEWITAKHIGGMLELNELETEFLRYLSSKCPELSNSMPTEENEMLGAALEAGRTKSKNLSQLKTQVDFALRKRPIPIDGQALESLTVDARETLNQVARRFETIEEWHQDAFADRIKAVAVGRSIAVREVFGAIRLSLAGSSASLGVYELLKILGREESLGRISDCLAGKNPTRA